MICQCSNKCSRNHNWSLFYDFHLILFSNWLQTLFISCSFFWSNFFCFHSSVMIMKLLRKSKELLRKRKMEKWLTLDNELTQFDVHCIVNNHKNHSFSSSHRTWNIILYSSVCVCVFQLEPCTKISLKS